MPQPKKTKSTALTKEHFDRLAATQSLASEIQSLRLDVKVIKERVEKLETAKHKN